MSSDGEEAEKQREAAGQGWVVIMKRSVRLSGDGEEAKKQREKQHVKTECWVVMVDEQWWWRGWEAGREAAGQGWAVIVKWSVWLSGECEEAQK